MRRSNFCYFHGKFHKSTRGVKHRELEFSAIEDTAGINLAVVQTLNALIGKRIDARQAGLALYGIQILANKVVGNIRTPRRKSVRDVSRSKNGGELAPELCVNEMGWGKSYEDCSECPRFDACKDGTYESNDEEPSEEDEEENLAAESVEDPPSTSIGEDPVLTVEETEAATTPPID